MISPEDMETYGYGHESIFLDLEQRILKDIVRRIKSTGVITRSADFQLNQLKRIGFSDKDIKEMLTETLKLSNEYVDNLYTEAIKTDYIDNKLLYEATSTDFLPFEKNILLQNNIKALKKITNDEMKNLSRSLGFVVLEDGKTKAVKLTEYFQNVLDQVIVDVTAGAFDYNTTLRKAINAMTKSGVRWIDYESGYHNRITVAARRAVMSSIAQMSRALSEDTARRIGTNDYEVSAHANPRPTHALWQGLVFTRQELVSICGLGTVTGLGGANCYHTYYPFVKGISVRAYTDEELEEMANSTPKEWNGKEYTGYEAKQRMRQMESNMRMYRERIALLKEGDGNELDIMNAQIQYRSCMDEYVRFSKAMGMKQQKERIYMDGLGKVGASGINTDNLIKKRNLMKGYQKAQKSGDISMLVEFQTYQRISDDIDKKIVGTATKDGIMITGYKTHFVDRVIGQYESSDEPIKGKRKGVSIEMISNALQNGESKEKPLTRSGLRSISYQTDECIVTINPDTGELIQTTPKK